MKYEIAIDYLKKRYSPKMVLLEKNVYLINNEDDSITIAVRNTPFITSYRNGMMVFSMGGYKPRTFALILRKYGPTNSLLSICHYKPDGATRQEIFLRHENNNLILDYPWRNGIMFNSIANRVMGWGYSSVFKINFDCYVNSKLVELAR